MADPFEMKDETELWHALEDAQRDYVRSLERLDALVLEKTDANSLPLDWRQIEEAALIRQTAFKRYRQAMDSLSGHLREKSSSLPALAQNGASGNSLGGSH